MAVVARPSNADSKATVTRILLAASELARREPPVGITLRRIATEAALSPGTVTYYFPHRDAIFSELAARWDEFLVGVLSQGRAGQQTTPASHALAQAASAATSDPAQWTPWIRLWCLQALSPTHRAVHLQRLLETPDVPWLKARPTCPHGRVATVTMAYVLSKALVNAAWCSAPAQQLLPWFTQACVRAAAGTWPELPAVEPWSPTSSGDVEHDRLVQAALESVAATGRWDAASIAKAAQVPLASLKRRYHSTRGLATATVHPLERMLEQLIGACSYRVERRDELISFGATHALRIFRVWSPLMLAFARDSLLTASAPAFTNLNERVVDAFGIALGFPPPVLELLLLLLSDMAMFLASLSDDELAHLTGGSPEEAPKLAETALLRLALACGRELMRAAG